MNAKRERVRGWTDRVNVSALPFIAGVALTISGVLSFVLGLYTFNRWFGWCFIVLGVLLSVTGLALDRGADWARVFAGFLAIASLAFTAVWLTEYLWFAIAVIGFDVLALTAIGRSALPWGRP